VRIHLAYLVTVLCCIPAQAQTDGTGDVIMRAMRDEMQRSMKQLNTGNLEKPYFISYRVVDLQRDSVGATFGSLSQSNGFHVRRLTVDVRVGDYKLDNSHFFSFNFDMGARLRIFNGTVELPLDDDYKEVRRQIWLATDAAYKKAVEDLSNKRGLLQAQNREDEADDFSREAPAVSSYDLPLVKLDRTAWESEARALSALFRQMPGIYTSSVLFNCFRTDTRFLTSEGTSYVRREPSLTFTGTAATQANDGMPLEDLIWAQARSLSEMPSQQELASRLEAMGHQLTELRNAGTIASYNGPVLVEGDAAPLLVRWLLLPNLVAVKRTVTDRVPGQANLNQNLNENPFLDRIGARVLPDFLSVVDDPTIHDYNGRALAGFSKFDEDGLPSRQIILIDKGVLKTLLASRDPVRGIDHSTGSRHAGQAAPSNVIITASNGLSQTDLQAKFMDMVKQRNESFGIVVRRVRNGNAFHTAVMAYKAFPDGHEELVRGVQFFQFSVPALKEIAAASRELNYMTLRYQPPMGQFGLPNESEENFTPVSVLAPSLLFEDVSLRKVRGATPNPPILVHPFFDKSDNARQ
jgi:predicted Zn-dependent protease